MGRLNGESYTDKLDDDAWWQQRNSDERNYDNDPT
jgi:hypothetical protein